MLSLVGDDARGVTVKTYHALALRLTGTSLAGSESQGRTIDFDQLLGDAVDLLEGRTDGFADADEARDRLLPDYDAEIAQRSPHPADTQAGVRAARIPAFRLSLRYVALMCYSQRRIGDSACQRRPFVYRKN